MTNKNLYLPITFCLLASCNNETKTTHNNSSGMDEKTTKTEGTGSCFQSAHHKDTITLQIDEGENGVTGNLVYNIYEKDKNTGMISGQMKGDTLIAEYTFLSEGIISSREVAFLQQGNELVEGYGEMAEKNGKMVFKNKSALNFESKTKLVKVDCTGIIQE